MLCPHWTSVSHLIIRASSIFESTIQSATSTSRRIFFSSISTGLPRSLDLFSTHPIQEFSRNLFEVHDSPNEQEQFTETNVTLCWRQSPYRLYTSAIFSVSIHIFLSLDFAVSSAFRYVSHVKGVALYSPKFVQKAVCLTTAPFCVPPSSQDSGCLYCPCFVRQIRCNVFSACQKQRYFPICFLPRCTLHTLIVEKNHK